MKFRTLDRVDDLAVSPRQLRETNKLSVRWRGVAWHLSACPLAWRGVCSFVRLFARWRGVWRVACPLVCPLVCPTVCPLAAPRRKR